LDAFFRISDVFNGQFRTKSYTGLIHHFYSSLAPQTPSSLENQSQTYSNYKSHNTFKALVGISTTGAVVFISKLWGGSASDVEITRRSGLIDMLDSRDAVMVDKGFVHLKYLTEVGKRLVMAEHMKKIASATGLNANGSVPCKILKFLICSIFLST
jgi:hypothetical protein